MSARDANSLAEWLLGRVGAGGAGLAVVYGATVGQGPLVPDADPFNLLTPTITIPASALVEGAVIEVVAVIEITSTSYPTPTFSGELLAGADIIATSNSNGAQSQASSCYLRGESVVTENGGEIAGATFGWCGVPNQFAVANYSTGGVVLAAKADTDLTIQGRYSLAAPDANVSGRLQYMRVTVTPPASLTP